MMCNRSVYGLLSMFFFFLLTINYINSKKLDLTKLKKQEEEELGNNWQKYYNFIISDSQRKMSRYFNNRKQITLGELKSFFSDSAFGKIASYLANSIRYVQGYYDFFSIDLVFNERSFTNFYALFYLEQLLLIRGEHPTLSSRFPNENNVNYGKNIDNEVTLNYWNSIKKDAENYTIPEQGMDSFMLKRFISEKNFHKNMQNLDLISIIYFFSETSNNTLNRDEFTIMYASIYFQTTRPE